MGTTSHGLSAPPPSRTSYHTSHTQTPPSPGGPGVSVFGAAPAPPSTCTPSHIHHTCTPDQSLFPNSSQALLLLLPTRTCSLAVSPTCVNAPSFLARTPSLHLSHHSQISPSPMYS